MTPQKLQVRAWDDKEQKMLYGGMRFSVGQLIDRYPPEHLMLGIFLHDSKGIDVYVGDFVVVTRSMMRGDGYVRKGFPRSIRYIMEVMHYDGRDSEVGFDLQPVCIYGPDFKAYQEYWYRSIDWRLQEDRGLDVKTNEYIYSGKCSTINIVGNRHQDPEYYRLGTKQLLESGKTYFN